MPCRTARREWWQRNALFPAISHRHERGARLLNDEQAWPSAHGAFLPLSRHSPPPPQRQRRPSGCVAGHALVHASSRGPYRGAHGSCGWIVSTLASKLFKELGEVRIGSRTPERPEPGVVRLLTRDSHMDHLGGSKPVPKGLRDLGDGFLLGGRHDPGFRDAQGLGHISMCGFCSDDDRIVHRIARPREGCKMVAADLIPVHRPAVPERYVTLSTVICAVPAATGEKPQPSTWFGQRPSRSRSTSFTSRSSASFRAPSVKPQALVIATSCGLRTS